MVVNLSDSTFRESGSQKKLLQWTDRCDASLFAAEFFLLSNPTTVFM